MITRRAFVTGLGVAILAAPLADEAQQTGRVWRIGLIGVSYARPQDGLVEGLRELGYVEGKNLIIERRVSEGRAERFPEFAAEFVQLKVDVIIVTTTPAAIAAKNATRTIPIVFPTAIDPVAAGVVASLARPGGNVTGLSMLSPELSGKGLALLKEAVPGLSRVAVIWNAANPANVPAWREAEGAARALGLRLHSQPVREPADIVGALSAITREQPHGLTVLIDALVYQHRKQIIDFTAQKRLPSVFQVRDFTDLGGLMSYGPNLRELFHRGAYYVDKILKGAKPGELPIEQPTKFELVINMKPAKALDLTIPQSLLLRADQVIE